MIAALSISDDDLCASCGHCEYAPGESSGCVRGFPARFDADGYAVQCIEFHPVPMGTNLGVSA